MIKVSSLFLALVVGAGPACRQEKPAARSAGERKGSVESRVMATVNGTPIFDQDVDYWLAVNTQGRIEEGTPEQRRNALEVLVTLELIRQEAEKLGLHRNSQYRAKLRAKQAEIDLLRRTEMRRLFYLQQVKESARVTPDEARAYFDEHAGRIRTRYHVQRILRRSLGDIQEVKTKLDGGASFEELARDGAGPGPGPDGKWDLGYLAWLELAEDWRAAIEGLEPGGVSEVLSGSGRRHWILRLIDKKEDPDISFERVQAELIANIREQRIAAQREGVEEKLRSAANIVYTGGAPDGK